MALMLGICVACSTSHSAVCDAATPSASLTPTATIRPGALPVAIVGDSLSSGFKTPGDPWTRPAQASLDAAHVPAQLVNSAEAGAGYVACGDQQHNFADLARLAVDAHTAVVVFFGSDNDLGASGLASAVRSTLALARHLAPHSQLLVIGPPGTNVHPPSELTDIRDTLKAAAGAIGAQFVDALNWFAGASATYLGPDGEHPNTAGEDYLAGKMVPLIESAVHRTPTG